MSGEERRAELNAVLARAYALLSELFDPVGVLLYWSAALRHIDGRRPCDLVRDGDIDALTRMCNWLDALADGAVL